MSYMSNGHGIVNAMDMSLSRLGVGDGQGNLACCNPWGLKELDKTEQLNWLIKERKYSVLWGESKWLFGNINRPLKEQMEDVIVGDSFPGCGVDF